VFSSLREDFRMLPITALAKVTERHKTIGVAARDNIAIKSVEIESSRTRFSPPSVPREVSIHRAAEVDDALSLRILWKLTLGILCIAVAAATITLIISN
jgi:hypothetical protein